MDDVFVRMGLCFLRMDDILVPGGLCFERMDDSFQRVGLSGMRMDDVFVRMGLCFLRMDDSFPRVGPSFDTAARHEQGGVAPKTHPGSAPPQGSQKGPPDVFGAKEIVFLAKRRG